MSDRLMPLRYRAAGFAFDSEISLPELSAERRDDGVPPDIEFRLGDPPGEGVGLSMRLKDFGFTAMDGRRVVVSILTPTRAEAVGRAVATAGLNAIAYQRGLLPLHASAVAVDDGCVAFCGARGAGKSTLAAALAQAGYPLLSDDLLVVHRGPGTGAMVWPALTRPKLTRKSIELLGGRVEMLTPIADWDLKAVTAVGEPAHHRSYRLLALYLLEWGEPALRRLAPLEAAAALNRCLRKPEWLEQVSTASTIRRRWLEFAASVPVISVCRRPVTEFFPDLPQSLAESWRRDRLAETRSNPFH